MESISGFEARNLSRLIFQAMKSRNLSFLILGQPNRNWFQFNSFPGIQTRKIIVALSTLFVWIFMHHRSHVRSRLESPRTWCQRWTWTATMRRGV